MAGTAMDLTSSYDVVQPPTKADMKDDNYAFMVSLSAYVCTLRRMDEMMYDIGDLSEYSYLTERVRSCVCLIMLLGTKVAFMHINFFNVFHTGLPDQIRSIYDYLCAGSNELPHLYLIGGVVSGKIKATVASAISTMQWSGITSRHFGLKDVDDQGPMHQYSIMATMVYDSPRIVVFHQEPYRLVRSLQRVIESGRFAKNDIIARFNQEERLRVSERMKENQAWRLMSRCIW